jgi:hypothetical protein
MQPEDSEEVNGDSLQVACTNDFCMASTGRHTGDRWHDVFPLKIIDTEEELEMTTANRRPTRRALPRWFSAALRLWGIAALALVACASTAVAQTTAQKPNILVIMGDDIGWFNPSAYHQGIMGYQTPNIDRIAKAGARFTDWYGQQSCTAGRAAFVTGQSPIRTGLTKVGLPGADIGLRVEDPSVAELLKPLGYATGQFGKNHR